MVHTTEIIIFVACKKPNKKPKNIMAVKRKTTATVKQEPTARIKQEPTATVKKEPAAHFNPTPSPLEAKWYAIYTRPRAEKQVAERLHEKGIHVYLPLQKKLRQWSDRKK